MKTILTTPVFDDWFSHLKDRQAKRRIQARIDLVEFGHFGDCKPVGEGGVRVAHPRGAGLPRVFHTAGIRDRGIAGGRRQVQPGSRHQDCAATGARTLGEHYGNRAIA